jgi:hypothetical protein
MGRQGEQLGPINLCASLRLRESCDGIDKTRLAGTVCAYQSYK